VLLAVYMLTLLPKIVLIEDLSICHLIEKIRNGLNGIIRGLGESDPCRKPEVENLVALSLLLV
jgi:hypothetical protein